ncbi:hypothetical protein [Streptomyces sp. NPDC059533]
MSRLRLTVKASCPSGVVTQYGEVETVTVSSPTALGQSLNEVEVF